MCVMTFTKSGTADRSTAGEDRPGIVAGVRDGVSPWHFYFAEEGDLTGNWHGDRRWLSCVIFKHT